ncbi:MAG: RNA 2',3'-cyclic phosphodiesterase [Candidatus Bathyarchaeia archaeon]
MSYDMEWRSRGIVEGLVRCFIAVDVYDHALKESILEVQRRLESLDAKFTFVDPEKMHLTLKFLGEVSDSKIGEIKESLGDLKFPPFDLRLEGVGVFPNPNRPRVIWIGVSEGADEISKLAEKVDDSLRRLGFPSETKGFKPHLTIARVKRGGGAALARILQEYSLRDFGTSKVESVKLKKSVLTPSGPIYTTLHEWKASQG